MKKSIGKYFLGLESVEVLFDTKTNDSYAHLPGNWVRGAVYEGSLVIGFDQGWNHVVGGLLHEATEYVCVRLQYRYHQDLRAHEGPSVGLIVMTHDQFSEVADAAGSFMAVCLPDLAKAYHKYKK